MFVDVKCREQGPGTRIWAAVDEAWAGVSVSTELSEMCVYHLSFSIFQIFYFQLNVASEERERESVTWRVCALSPSAPAQTASP